MLLLEDTTTAVQRSSAAVSIASTAPVHRPEHEGFGDHVVARTRSLLHDFGQVVGLWLRRRSDRAMLRAMSLRDIHDFCPRQAEAEAEMNKPFWRA